MTNVLTKRMCRRRSLQRGAVLACTVINIVLCLMLAAGLLPFALGSETWGSIVCPASTVGVTAYRPTGGTIPNNGMLQVCTTESCSGMAMLHANPGFRLCLGLSRCVPVRNRPSDQALLNSLGGCLACTQHAAVSVSWPRQQDMRPASLLSARLRACVPAGLSHP